jgi:hypothetical protein
MTLGPLFDEGSRLKSEGMALADAAEGDDWKARADRAIRELAASGQDFGAEDVRAIAGNPSRPNAFGSRFLAAARAGLIVKVGYRNSLRPSLHSHPVAVWRGVK